MKCSCVDVSAGSYANQKVLFCPPTVKQSQFVGIDACIALEIIDLWWVLNIVTTGCCCGHNKYPPYIGVVDDHIPLMKRLGYRVHHNPCRPGDEDSFYPRSLI